MEKDGGGDTRYLPDELILIILRFLPVKTAFQCSCVCKTWRNLILQDPVIHLSPLTHSFIFVEDLQNNCNRLVPLDKDKKTLSLSKDVLLRYGLVHREGLPPVRIAASCHGLLLCLRKMDECYIVNPLTREYLCIPIPKAFNPEDCKFELVFDPQENIPCKSNGNNDSNAIAKFKVVMFYFLIPQRYRFRIYSSEDSAWRVSTWLLEPLFHSQRQRCRSPRAPAAYCNRALHWLLDKDTMLVFDMDSDNCSYANLPSSRCGGESHSVVSGGEYPEDLSDGEYPQDRLTKCKDELHFMRIYHTQKLSIWKKKPKTAGDCSSSWIHLHVVELATAIRGNSRFFRLRGSEPHIFSPVDMNQRGNKVILRHDRQLLSYDLESSKPEMLVERILDQRTLDGYFRCNITPTILSTKGRLFFPKLQHPQSWVRPPIHCLKFNVSSCSIFGPSRTMRSGFGGTVSDGCGRVRVAFAGPTGATDEFDALIEALSVGANLLQGYSSYSLWVESESPPLIDWLKNKCPAPSQTVSEIKLPIFGDTPISASLINGRANYLARKLASHGIKCSNLKVWDDMPLV